MWRRQYYYARKSRNNIILNTYYTESSKDNAIQFNATVDETLTLIRAFSKDELEKVIEDEYKPYDNGLYRYSEIKNGIKHDFYVTKDELMKYLSKSLFYVCIVFKCSVFIDKSKIKSIYDIEQ